MVSTNEKTKGKKSSATVLLMRAYILLLKIFLDISTFEIIKNKNNRFIRGF